MPDISKEVKEMLEIAAQRGAKKALEEEDKARRKSMQQKRDKRLRNTKRLLTNYRRLKKHAETAVYSSMQEEVEDFMDLMWDPYDKAEQTVFSIKTSATRTSIIMAHVTAELEQYRKLCYASPNSIDHDRADALFARYIDEDEKTVDQIASMINADKRTVYRYIDKALNDVSAFMFGIDGIVVTDDE